MRYKILKSITYDDRRWETGDTLLDNDLPADEWPFLSGAGAVEIAPEPISEQPKKRKGMVETIGGGEGHGDSARA